LGPRFPFLPGTDKNREEEIRREGYYMERGLGYSTSISSKTLVKASYCDFTFKSLLLSKLYLEL
jgi:hypothetical protein